MKIEKKKLLEILEKVKSGIASKDAIESMTYFMFSGKDIITYNDQISIQHPLKTEFELFVKATDLYRIISKLKDESVTLTEKDNMLNIKGKSINANLATIKDEEVQERVNQVKKSLKKAKWDTLPENFSQSITGCSFVASKEESAQALTCVYVNDKECTSSDNKRIAKASLKTPVKSMLLKASEIKNLTVINSTEYAITKSWLHFRNEDKCIFSIRKINGEFPDFSEFFEFKGTKVNLSTNILEGTDIVSVLTEADDPAINIKMANGICVISGKSDAGKIQHKSKIKYKGKEINFTINPDFLKEMMSHSSSVLIGEDKAKLQTDNGFSLVTSFYAE